MYKPHRRVGNLLRQGGYIAGPVGTTRPYYVLHNKTNQFCGWCQAKTIEHMVAAGLLTKRPSGRTPITAEALAPDFKQAIDRLLERQSR